MSGSAMRMITVLLLALLGLSGCGGGSSADNKVIAKAGLAQDVTAGNVVTLDGSKSTGPSQGLLAYQWTLVSKPAGSGATISDPTTVNPTLHTDLPGQYAVKLTVTDHELNSSEDTITVTALPSGVAAPVARAGVPQNVVVGTFVTLDGSGSSAAGGGPLTYDWQLSSKPAGSDAALSSASVAKPSFTADVAGSYSFSLVVHDGRSSSSAATVTVNAFLPQVAPIANAGAAQNVIVGSLVTLNGSGSTSANREPLTYSWAFISRPAGSSAALSSPSAARPTFTADVTGSYALQLLVHDGSLSSAAATVTVTADTLNAITVTPPEATIGVGETKRFYAVGSFETVGDKDISALSSWSSSDTAVAIIDNTGLAAVTGRGTTIISASAAGKSHSATLTVGDATLVGLRVDRGPAFSVAIGNSLQLTATATYSDRTKKDVTELASWAAAYAYFRTDCISLSDQPGTKGLLSSLGRSCYEPISVTYGGMKNTAGVSIR